MTIHGVGSEDLGSRIATIQYEQSHGPFHTTSAAPLRITYNFGNSRPADLFDSAFQNASNFTYLETNQRQMVRSALAEYASYINVEFVESTAQGAFHLSFLRAGQGVPDGQGWWQYTYGGGLEYDGAVVFDTALNFDQSWVPWLILHEIGHAMSFKHTGNYDVLGGGAPGPFLPESEDNFQFTVMSYHDNPDTSQHPENLMLYDIAALQERWGINTSNNVGDDVHVPRSDGNVSVVWDAGGIDEIAPGTATGNVSIDLREGHFSEFSIAGDSAFGRLAIAYGAEIENASGRDGNDILHGNPLGNLLNGGDGSDTLIGGNGNDSLVGGDSDVDVRDVLYGGAGNDSIDGGHGNDELRGDAGDDRIAGGFGADTVIGGAGNDTLTGSAFSDQIFGGDGDDFVNGGWGHDRVNGGAGADQFFHIGIFNHGSDWIQDYDASEGDVLMFGNSEATASQFQINAAHRTSADGERAGDDDIAEAFVIYRPTGQIMWALVDGMGQDSINLQIGEQVFDLMA